MLFFSQRRNSKPIRTRCAGAGIVIIIAIIQAFMVEPMQQVAADGLKFIANFLDFLIPQGPGFV